MQECHKRRLALFIFALTLTLSVCRPLAQSAVLTGQWAFALKIDGRILGGAATASVELKQDGEKLSGWYTSDTLGRAALEGTVKGKDFSFVFKAEKRDLTVTYKGMVDDKGALSGQFDWGGNVPAGTFTATRLPAASR